jgi:hypothetical protein
MAAPPKSRCGFIISYFRNCSSLPCSENVESVQIELISARWQATLYVDYFHLQFTRNRLLLFIYCTKYEIKRIDFMVAKTSRHFK